MSFPAGFIAAIYRGPAGSQASTKMINVKDASMTQVYAEADISDRSCDIELVQPTMQKIEIKFTMNWSNDDADCIAIASAFHGKTPLAIFATDGEGEGIDGDFYVFQNDPKWNLKEGQPLEVTLKPTKCAAGGFRTPVWVTAT